MLLIFVWKIAYWHVPLDFCLLELELTSLSACEDAGAYNTRENAPEREWVAAGEW